MTIILVCLLTLLAGALPVTTAILMRQMRWQKEEAHHSWVVAQEFCQLTGECARLLDRVRVIYACDPDALAKAIHTLSEVEQAVVKQDRQGYNRASKVAQCLTKIESTMREHSAFIGQSREYDKKAKPGEAGIGKFR